MRALAVILVATIFSVKVDGLPQSSQFLGLQPTKSQGPQQGTLPGPPTQLFNSFTTPELNEMVNRIIKQATKFRALINNRGMNVQCVLDQIALMFINYELTLEKASSCATDDMRALPGTAISDILSCIPTLEELQQKIEAAKENFNALLDKLKEADADISVMTDDVKKLAKISEEEWTDLYQFYINKADEMFKDLGKLNTCMNTKRAEIQTKVIKYLGELENCPQ